MNIHQIIELNARYILIIDYNNNDNNNNNNDDK